MQLRHCTTSVTALPRDGYFTYFIDILHVRSRWSVVTWLPDAQVSVVLDIIQNQHSESSHTTFLEDILGGKITLWREKRNQLVYPSSATTTRRLLLSTVVPIQGSWSLMAQRTNVETQGGPL